MLRRINERDTDSIGIEIPHVRAAEASFPAPFRSGLEYSSPARGTWNIVHTGMLIPEAHEIYVCAAGCLRGVVLTAAEMGTADRFSTVAVRENNLLDGDMEELMIEGVTDIISKLPVRPPAVLVYTSCVHHFAGCDLDMMYARLRERFPDIDFTDCYMNPVMRKSGLTPDQLMRSRLYTLLHKRPISRGSVAIIGNDLPTDAGSDLFRLLEGAGLRIREITSCRTYEEYQEMAESAVYISYNPDAAPGGDMLSDRLGGRHINMKLSFDPDEIDGEFDRLAEVLAECCCTPAGGPDQAADDISDRLRAVLEEIRREGRSAAAGAVRQALELIGDTPVAIDSSYCPRPMSLARFLLDSGFNVTAVYLDAIPGADKADLEYIQENYPDLILKPTVHTSMRFAASWNKDAAAWEGRPHVLAIGQKAAYFEDTDHFVNIVEGGGMIGYQAIIRTLELMREAYAAPKDRRGLIQVKGLGCEVCL